MLSRAKQSLDPFDLVAAEIELSARTLSELAPRDLTESTVYQPSLDRIDRFSGAERVVSVRST